MIGKGLYVGDCELGMISIWVVHEKLDTYICACGHKYGMSDNGSWWLVNQWHGFGMRRNTLLMVGNNELVLIRHVRNEDWLQMLDEISCVMYVKILGCLLCWSMLVHNSLGSLDETFRVVLQWSRRNSMTPVSGCPWWCPVYMVW